MTDKQYGTYQTPSSRPPEPPYRSGAQEAANAGMPVTSAEQRETMEPMQAGERAYHEQPTESFQEARFGNTEEMPAEVRQREQVYREQGAEPMRRENGEEPAYRRETFMDARTRNDASDRQAYGDYDSSQAYRQADAGRTYRESAESRAYSEPAASQAYRAAGAGSNGFDATPNAQARSSSAPRHGSSAPARDYTSTARVQPAAATAATAPKRGGAGKTFLFGFLGALLACALAFGCFFAFNGFKTSASANTTTANIGTSDSSVINAVEEGQTLAEAVAAKALPSVVAVYNYQKASNSTSSRYGLSSLNTVADDGTEAAGMGSGVVISEDGYIITNYHVVEDASKITVKVGDEERDATYVGGDDSTDVAVIKVDSTEGLVAADIGNSDDLVIGEWVMTIGAPLGLEQSVATGVVSATNRSTSMSNSDYSDVYSYYYGTTPQSYTYYPNMIQTDAVINPGNSGGALVDADGKLIGINTIISSYSGDYAGVGFAIPVNYAMGIAEQIIAGKTPSHAILGVSISSVNASNAQRYGLSSSTGAYVAEISPGTGAADSDLQVGDIITQIDDSKITSTSDVTLEVREHNPGDVVNVTVNRNGETKDIPVTLSSDENVSSSSNSQDSGNTQNGGPGSGRDRNNGGTNGYNSEQLEELLRMLGM